MTTTSGRDVAFDLYEKNIRVPDFDEPAKVNTGVGSVPGAIFKAM